MAGVWKRLKLLFFRWARLKDKSTNRLNLLLYEDHFL